MAINKKEKIALDKLCLKYGISKFKSNVIDFYEGKTRGLYATKEIFGTSLDDRIQKIQEFVKELDILRKNK